MQPAKLLPIPSGMPFSSWLDSWLKEISTELQSVIQDDASKLRERNERFSAYLVTMTIVIAQYNEKMSEIAVLFGAEFPRPEKGVTIWREALDVKLEPFKSMRDLVAQLHEDISRRLSVSQTAIRTIDSGVKHGV